MVCAQIRGFTLQGQGWDLHLAPAEPLSATDLSEGPRWYVHPAPQSYSLHLQVWSQQMPLLQRPGHFSDTFSCFRAFPYHLLCLPMVIACCTHLNVMVQASASVFRPQSLRPTGKESTTIIWKP